MAAHTSMENPFPARAGVCPRTHLSAEKTRDSGPSEAADPRPEVARLVGGGGARSNTNTHEDQQMALFFLFIYFYLNAARSALMGSSQPDEPEHGFISCLSPSVAYASRLSPGCFHSTFGCPPPPPNSSRNAHCCTPTAIRLKSFIVFFFCMNKTGKMEDLSIAGS